MPFSIIRQAPECAAVASCYCAKPPQTGCCGSSGTPKEKTTTAAVAAVATATAAVSQFSLQGVPHASAAKLPASIRVAKDEATTVLSVEKQKDGEELDDLHFTMKVVDLTTGLGAEQSTLVPVLGPAAIPIQQKGLSWHQIHEIFKAVDEQWHAGTPWSAFPQAKRRGRYIIEMITHTYGVSAREALACISQWQQRGYMATEGGKTMNRASGLRVVKYMESGQ